MARTEQTPIPASTAAPGILQQPTQAIRRPTPTSSIARRRPEETEETEGLRRVSETGARAAPAEPLRRTPRRARAAALSKRPRLPTVVAAALAGSSAIAARAALEETRSAPVPRRRPDRTTPSCCRKQLAGPGAAPI